MFQLSVQDIHPGEKAGDKEEAIRQVAAAAFKGGYREFGLRENGVGYADNEYNRAVVAPYKSKLEEIRNRILAGDIKIPINRKELK